MANTRIFYACQAVAIEPLRETIKGSNTFVPANVGQIVHGLQSVGINSSFNLEQIFELGQIQIYENIEGLPEIEITLEKVLDGYPLLYHLATVGVTTSVPTPAQRSELVARSRERCNVYLGITDESYNAINSIGNTVQAEVQCTGMYINSISYTLPVDGNCTESVTLVGNHKVWNKSSKINSLKTSWAAIPTIPLDVPANNLPPTYYGGVQRKENVLIKQSRLPKSIPGADVNNPLLNNVHIQNVTISTDLGREDILELGSRVPYARPANYPVEVTCEIEVISVAGDQVNAYAAGDPELYGTANAGSNTIAEEIIFKLNDGTVFDLGKGNRLSSVNYTGGDAGGGNVSVTYSYVTYNELRVIQRNDPAFATNTSSPNGIPVVTNLQP